MASEGREGDRALRDEIDLNKTLLRVIYETGDRLERLGMYKTAEDLEMIGIWAHEEINKLRGEINNG